MTKVDERLVTELLGDHGVDGLEPLHFAARRLGCTVWGGRLLTPHGDAAFQVLVYPLGEQPESYVDLEEEIESLTLANSARHLARELRDDHWAILITCAKQDALILDGFIKQAPENQSTVSYHPQLDRVLGGDYFHEVNGKWLKACIASTERAVQMPDLLKAAESAYVNGRMWMGKLERPLPKLLAVLTIPDLTVAEAPSSYDELALMQFVVEGRDVIQRKPHSSVEAAEAFARQLFGFLATQHHAGIYFSRDAGCCIRPEFLLQSGALTDVYYTLRLQGETSVHARETDLWNALTIACETAKGTQQGLISILTSAVVQYRVKETLSRDLGYLIESAAGGMARNDPTGLRVLLKTAFLKT
ncbi:MAG TPA: hypothetical protein VII95_05510 [Terriglobales bacterium]|jgi:hypothetical protein